MSLAGWTCSAVRRQAGSHGRVTYHPRPHVQTHPAGRARAEAEQPLLVGEVRADLVAALVWRGRAVSGGRAAGWEAASCGLTNQVGLLVGDTDSVGEAAHGGAAGSRCRWSEGGCRETWSEGGSCRAVRRGREARGAHDDKRRRRAARAGPDADLAGSTPATGCWEVWALKIALIALTLILTLRRLQCELGPRKPSSNCRF